MRKPFQDKHDRPVMAGLMHPSFVVNLRQYFPFPFLTIDLWVTPIIFSDFLSSPRGHDNAAIPT